jgi:hypothetical protein
MKIADRSGYIKGLLIKNIVLLHIPNLINDTLRRCSNNKNIIP